jgi:uncharacterized protein
MGALETPSVRPGAPWLADEMLGKLARYLRFLGDDTAYLRGLTEAERLARSVAEHRTLVTRDRALAQASRTGVLLRTVAVGDQLAEMFVRVPSLAHPPRFDRCPECNALLRPWEEPPSAEPATAAPAAVRARGVAVASCPECGRYYWEGSHAERIRRVIAEAAAGVGRS